MEIAADLNVQELVELLRQLARHDERLMRAEPALLGNFWRALSRGELRYVLEAGDTWSNVREVLRDRRYDCEDVAAIVAASGKIWGMPAQVGIGQRPGSRGGHAFTRLGAFARVAGRIIDLCPAGGMGYPPDGEIYRRAIFLEV